MARDATCPRSPFDLTGRVALVTGGNSGIGRGIAAGLARAGAQVMIWGRDEARCRGVVDELRDLGGTADHAVCDVSDEAAVERAFAATVDRFGQVDCCVANAGIAGSARFAELSLDEWRRMMSANAESAFLTFRETVRHLLERGSGGSLVATSSLAAVEGVPRSSHYAASKAAVDAMVRTLAVELAPAGIRVNGIHPGTILTPMSERRFNGEAAKTKLLPRVPAGRWGTPDDLAGIVVYLASDASTYHTGQMFAIDGGFSIA